MYSQTNTNIKSGDWIGWLELGSSDYNQNEVLLDSY